MAPRKSALAMGSKRYQRRAGYAPLNALLLIPRISDSIHFRAYLETVGSKPFLGWWVDRFLERNPRLELSIICQTERQDSEVRRALEARAVRIIRAEAGTTLGCMAIVARMGTRRDIALLPMGFLYAPPDLLARVHAHHRNSHNNYTRVIGLPRGATPEIYASDLLIKLSELRLAGLPTLPGPAAEMILGASRSGSPLPQFHICAIPFDAAASYSAAANHLPEQVSIAWPHDIDVARYVCDRLHNVTGPLSGLRLWREASLATRLERREQLLGSAPPRRPAKSAPIPRRVLFISFPSAFWGAENSLLQLVSRVDRARYQPFFLAGMEGLLTRRLREIQVQVISCAGFGGNGAEDSLYVANVIQKTKPHLLHLNAPSGPVPILAQALWGIPVVAHLRIAETRGYEAQLKASDAIIVVSEFVRREVLKLEIPEEAVHVVYNGVDSEHFRRNRLNGPALREKFGIPQAGKVALMIARFSPEKRHDLLLQAARLVKPQLPNLFVVLNGDTFGESPAFDFARAFIERHGMGSWVRIIPFVEDIRELHSIADALVLCSEREALARCVIEAMAMEVPVIVTNSGGLAEIVQHGKTGFVVPPGDVESLASQIVSTFATPELCRRVTRAARRHIEQHYDAALAAHRVMALYDRVLNEKSRRRHNMKR